MRIITPQPDHTTPADPEEVISIMQPLLQRFRDVLKEHFPPASVTQINRDPNPGNTDNAGRDRDSRRDDRPNNKSKNGRNRSQSPANNNNNRLSRDGPVDSGNFRPGYNRPQSPAPNGQQPSGNYQNRYRPPSPSSYRDQRPQQYRNQSPYRGPPHQFRSQSPAPRWQQRSQTPPPRWSDRRPGTPPPAGYRDYQPRQYFNSNFQNSPQSPAGNNRPPWNNSFPFRRRPKSGCFVCGTFGRHSDLHNPRYEDNATPVSRPPSTNPFMDNTVPPQQVPPMNPNTAQGNTPWVRRSAIRAPWIQRAQHPTR